MAGPFAWVSEGAQPRLLLALTLALLLLSAWLLRLDRPLVTPAAPNGIVSFELAGDLERASAILASWSLEARSSALLGLGLDFLYLLVYPAWFSLAASRLGARLGGGWSRAGGLTAWAVLLAAPLDAAENHALIHQAMQGPSALHAQLAWWCAVPKFALVALAGAYLLTAGGAWLRLRARVAW